VWDSAPLFNTAISLLKGLFERGGSPERVSRGIAAGVLGVCFPSHVLRFPAALLAALFFRGNRVAAVLIPAVAILFDLQFIARIDIALTRLVWFDASEHMRLALAALNYADFAWSWLHPLRSLLQQISELCALSGSVALALGCGSLVLGLVAGALTYPVSLISISFFYDAKLRAQRYLEWSRAHQAEPFKLTAVPDWPEPLATSDVIWKYCGAKREFHTCESVLLLIDGGEAFPEMLAAIASARKTLVLETYILRDDKFGTLFAEALKSAARRGVKTRVICDGVGSMNLPDSYKAGLVEAGVELRVFHPISSVWQGGFGFLQRRDHRKIIVADAHVSLIGGLNIADEYAAVADGGGGWRDTHIRLDGVEAARAFTGIFEETWRKAEPVLAAPKSVDSESAHPYDLPPPAQEDWTQSKLEALHARQTSENLPMRILSNRELLMRMRIKRAYLKAIRAAQFYILIENAFFIPDRDVLRALYGAVRRGVKVAVVVAMQHDVRVAAMAARALYDELLAHGVRLFEYPISMIHSKVAVIDDCWSIVSSYNLNHRSLIHDLEVGALFFDDRFARALRDQILTDITKCNELTKDLHRARPWNVMLMESCCYQFRYWL